MNKGVSKTLYEKRGRRFVAVGKDDFAIPHGPGDYVVRVRRNHQNMRCDRQKVDVDYAKVEVALVEAEDAVAQAIMRHSELEPKAVANTPREQRAFEAYKRIAGSESLTLSRKSAQEVARMSVMVMRENLEKALCPKGCARTAADREV